MKKIFLVLYSVSALATITLFVLVDGLTEPLQTESGLGGGANGNPGLFPILFFFPFLLFFLYGTTEFFMRWLYRKFALRSIVLATVLSLFGVIRIATSTVMEAAAFRSRIVEVNPSFDNESQVSLLNTFSNSIFFNLSTFVMILCVCFFLGGVWALVKRRVSPNEEFTKTVLISERSMK